MNDTMQVLEQAVAAFNAAFDRRIRAEHVNHELLLAMVEYARLRGRADIADCLWSASNKAHTAWAPHEHVTAALDRAHLN